MPNRFNLKGGKPQKHTKGYAKVHERRSQLPAYAELGKFTAAVCCRRLSRMQALMPAGVFAGDHRRLPYRVGENDAVSPRESAANSFQNTPGLRIGGLERWVPRRGHDHPASANGGARMRESSGCGDGRQVGGHGPES